MKPTPNRVLNKNVKKILRWLEKKLDATVNNIIPLFRRVVNSKRIKGNSGK